VFYNMKFGANEVCYSTEIDGYARGVLQHGK
jgi:hypothetical protein